MWYYYDSTFLVNNFLKDSYIGDLVFHLKELSSTVLIVGTLNSVICSACDCEKKQ